MPTNKFRPVEITIDLHTSTADNPFDPEYQSSNWKIYTFPTRGTRLISDTPHEDRYIIEGPTGLQPATAGLRSKFKAGTAHWVHAGRDSYQLCDVDRANGILLWEHPLKNMGAKDCAGRTEDARASLGEYSDWANGAVYGYSVTCEEADFEDSCGGFIGDKWLAENVRDSVKSLFDTWGLEFDDCEYTFTGDAKWLAEYLDLYRIEVTPAAV